MTIKLTTISDIKTFVTLANRHEEDLFLLSGNYKVNAKSLLGVLSLDLEKPVTIMEGATTLVDFPEFRQWEIRN